MHQQFCRDWWWARKCGIYSATQIMDVQTYLSLQGVEESENTLILATVIQESNSLAFHSLIFEPLLFVPNFSIHKAPLSIKNKTKQWPAIAEKLAHPLTEDCWLIYAGPFALQLFPHWLLGNHLSYCACLFYDNCHYDYFLIIQLGLWIKTAYCHSCLATASEHSQTLLQSPSKIYMPGIYHYLLTFLASQRNWRWHHKGSRVFVEND